MADRFTPAIVVALALTSGCLQKDTTETWYLGPAGAVTWVVTESDVRSDAQAAADRQNEESTYRQAFERQEHPVARGFRELGLGDIRTTVLRGEAPFTVANGSQGRDDRRAGSSHHSERRPCRHLHTGSRWQRVGVELLRARPSRTGHGLAR